MSDGRSSAARRLKDITRALITEVGGDPAIGLAALPLKLQLLIRALARVTVQLEILEAQSLDGEKIDAVAFVTLSNSQRRMMRDLFNEPKEKRKPGPKPKLPIITLPEVKPPTFHEVAAQVVAAREKDVAP